MIEIKKEAIKSWEAKKNAQFYIAKELFHRNAELFLKNFPELRTDITNALTQNLNPIVHKIYTKKGVNYKRVTATSINSTLRGSLKTIEDIKFEVEYKEGILFDSPKTGGFDFSIFDEELNIVNFRNYCFGERASFQGDLEWTQELDKRADWQSYADNLELPNLQKRGSNIIFPKNKPTVIGEIQLGNWALAYYDMFKVLHLDNLVDLDLFVYITATGNLNEYLSDGIVNYNRMESIIREYSSILKVPIWLIGIDVKAE